MATAALPMTNKISQSSTSTISFRTLKMQFGNGYSQRTKDGINDREVTWRIVYNNLTWSDRTTVMTFLDTVRGTDIITWTPLGGSAGKYVLDGDISDNPVTGNLYSISFNIRQVWDL